MKILKLNVKFSEDVRKITITNGCETIIPVLDLSVEQRNYNDIITKLTYTNRMSFEYEGKADFSLNGELLKKIPVHLDKVSIKTGKFPAETQILDRDGDRIGAIGFKAEILDGMEGTPKVTIYVDNESILDK